jgi:hypothetical protein
LARLRADPSVEAITQFERELACEPIRAQLRRLFESIAAVPPPAAAPVAPTPAPAASTPPVPPPLAARTPPADAPGQPTPEVRSQAPAQADLCARDGERLARLRADPTIEAIARFEKELGCERIRAQLRRLRESVGQ